MNTPVNNKLRWLLGLFGVAVIAAVAQTNSSSNSSNSSNSSHGPAMVGRSGQLGGLITAGGISFTGAVIEPGSPLEPVTGHPYSAEQVTDHVQMLADGTQIAQTTQKVMLYRDSEGRTRTERYFTPPEGAPMISGPVFIEITDPVAGYRYMLDQHSHVARRAPWPPKMHRVGPAAIPSRQTSASTGLQQPVNINPEYLVSTSGNAAATRSRPEMKHESLGTQIMDGVTSEGTRMTMTFPEGTVGNDRPITTLSETWMSRDLNIVVLTKVSDPRSGNNTTRLRNISQSEPDSTLFQVPTDYSITDDQQTSIVR